ncbi:sugar phosphate nucleotidyltransferase [Asaccharospora irregularis]|uniref:UTP--glucose-1-phosphate uridylyltransferase n=1 Tax=Asaccharospora irregularis DSM 2635 TaxID=1121321 RepID=A0A1M5SXT6_9FIRM|nr:sugar phosphate nucleotidyltransferase [Asaccharospora irregularis]SHH43170.1 Nucleotidyl transferase [Asaccharospora irregularis DSM 2635]
MKVRKAVIQEAIDSGVEEILIITGKSKKAIEDHFDKNLELELELEKKANDELLKVVRDITGLVDIHYIRQKEAKGLGHAIYCAKAFVGNEPFAIMLGDYLVYNQGTSCLKQLIDVYDEYIKYQC